MAQKRRRIVPPNPTRQPPYNEVQANLVLELIEHMSLSAACKHPGAPTRAAFHEWLRQHPALTDKYVRACEERATNMAEDALRIADESSEDTSPQQQKARLRVDTRKWFAARMAPKKWGERASVEVTGDSGGAIRIEGAREELARRIARLEAHRRREDGE